MSHSIQQKDTQNTVCIITTSGKRWDLLNPKAADLKLIDIAHALANEVRWAGHTPEFYSVAQHSVLVSYFVPSTVALEALFHDATEAFCKDLPTPLKHLLPSYKEIEEKHFSAIAERFSLDKNILQKDPYIKVADILLKNTEGHAFFPMFADWQPRLDIAINPMPPKEAERVFLERYRYLKSSGVMFTDGKREDEFLVKYKKYLEKS